MRISAHGRFRSRGTHEITNEEVKPESVWIDSNGDIKISIVMRAYSSKSDVQYCGTVTFTADELEKIYETAKRVKEDRTKSKMKYLEDKIKELQAKLTAKNRSKKQGTA